MARTAYFYALLAVVTLTSTAYVWHAGSLYERAVRAQIEAAVNSFNAGLDVFGWEEYGMATRVYPERKDLCKRVLNIVVRTHCNSRN